MKRILPPLLLSCLALAPGFPAAAAEAPVWSYMGGANDDEGWGELSPDYSACDTGRSQSPVALGAGQRSAMLPLDIRYRRSPVSIERRDRTLVIAAEEKNTLREEGRRYRLVEIRLHTPSEHEALGQAYPLELHLIHRDGEGKTLILGVFAAVASEDAGEVPPHPLASRRAQSYQAWRGDSQAVKRLGYNPALQSIIDLAPAKTKNKVPLSLDLKALLPQSRGYYAYSGSLSWPPCTEGVEWRVFKQPVIMSREQSQAIGGLIRRNARTLQPLYLRTVRETID